MLGRAAGVLNNLVLDKALLGLAAAQNARALCTAALAHFAVGSSAYAAANELIVHLPKAA